MNEGKDLANTWLLTKGSDTNQFNQFIKNMDTLINADSKTSEAWDKAKLVLFKYFKESDSTKKEALKAEYEKELAKTKEDFF